MEEWDPGACQPQMALLCPLITSALIPLSVFRDSLCFQTANLSRAGLRLSHLLPQHEVQRLEPSSHQEVSIDRGC